MTLTNAPDVITQFSTQLAACSSWTTGTAGHWYPSSVGTIATLHAVLASMNEERTKYAEGASGVPSGTLRANVFVPTSLGDAETLGRALIKELTDQDTGLAFRGGSCALAGEAGPSSVAGGDSMQEIEINMSFGLSA